MKTVRDFRRFICQQAGFEFGGGDFPQYSEAHREFWKKLNKIGARNIRSHSPELVPDIDATVHLSNDEWAELESEFHQLL